MKGLFGLQDLLFMLIHGLIWALPLGIVAFAAQLSAQFSAGIVMASLGKYVAVILGGNVIQFFIILPLLPFGKRLNPVRTLGKMMPAVLMALFTKSSAATLPVTIADSRRQTGSFQSGFPLCITYLYYHQHEWLRCVYPRNFLIPDAEWRNAFTLDYDDSLALQFQLSQQWVMQEYRWDVISLPYL